MTIPGYVELHDAITGKPILLLWRTVFEVVDTAPEPGHGLPESWRMVKVMGSSSERVYFVSDSYNEIKLALEIAIQEHRAGSPV